jgi:hypothetical protein
MTEDRRDTEEARESYPKPEIRDYGTLKELTAGSSSGHHVDVPRGTPVPPFNIFS